MKDQTLSLRERQKRETRLHIQEVAKAFIADKGYENTTVRALAKAAGVGVGTISLHFKDKKSLLLASFHEEIGEVARTAIATVPQDKPLREQIFYILSEVYQYYATNTKYLRAVVKEALFVGGEWGEVFDRQIKESVALVVGLLEGAKARGEVRRDLDCAAVTLVIWSIYINGLIDGLKQDVFNPDVQLAKITPLVDVVLAGTTP